MENKENTLTNIVQADNKSRECCACDMPKSGDFKQVITLKNSGLTIFLHKNVEVQKTSKKKSEETFILHNVGEKDLKRPDYISEMCQYKTKCMKCKSLVQRVRSLIDEIDDIKTDEVLGVCEYCKRSKTASKCRRCEYIVNKYLSLKSKVSQNKQGRFVSWLTKVNDLLRDVLNQEPVCKHRLYRDSHSVLELEQLLSELKSPLSQRKPEITYFPTTAPERFMSFSTLGRSKGMLEDILKRIKTEQSKHYASEDSLCLSSLRSSTGCVCKYFMSKRMEGRRSMEVLPQEKYYPPGLITSREFAKSLTSELRFRGSLDVERYGRRRSSSAEYVTKKYSTDYSKDGTSKERGRRSVLDKISNQYISGRSHEFGHSRERGTKRDGYGKEKGLKRDEYRSEWGSKRDEYGSARGSKRDGYGKERGSKRDEYESERGSRKDEYGKERGSIRDEYGRERGLKRDQYSKERESKRDEYSKERGSKRDESGSARRSKRDEYDKEKGSKRGEYSKERGSKRDESGSERGTMRDEYGKERGSKRDESGSTRGSKRDEYGKERGSKREEYGSEKSSKRYDSRAKDSKKEIPADAKNKLPGIASQKSKAGEHISTAGRDKKKDGKSKRQSSKEDISKKYTTKEVQIKDHTKEGKSKEDRLKEDSTKRDKESTTKKGIIKKDVKLGDSIELVSKDKTKTAKSKEDRREEIDAKFKKVSRKEDDLKGERKSKDKVNKEEDNIIDKKGTKTRKGTLKANDLKEDKKGKGKTDKDEDTAKKGTKTKKETLKEDDFEKEKKSKGSTEKEERASKKLSDIVITGKGKTVSGLNKKEAKVVIKDEEIRKRLKIKRKSKAQGDVDQESEESVSDIEDVKTSKKTKGKKGKESEKKSSTEIPIKKEKPSSEAVLLLKMMKELRLKREKEREAKHEKSREFAALAPLPVIKRTLKSKVEPLISESFIECDTLQAHEVKKIIIGSEIVHFDPTYKMKEGTDHKPLLFEIMQSFPDVLPHIIEAPPPALLPEPPSAPSESKKRPSSTKVKSKSKVIEEVVENTTGVLQYQLSNRKYIEDGCTILPTTKILRKMNTYNMQMACHEFDFFKVNKKKKIIFYDSGEKLAEIYSNECGKWFYKNGNLALHCYKPKEPNVRKRYVVYSSGDEKENGTYLPVTILGLFDQLGNAVIYDHFGNVRLKYNQSEGVLIDEKIGPPGRWKWHTLNDPPILQPVFIDTFVQERDLDDFIRSEQETEPSKVIKDPNVDMLMIEFENFVREKAHKLLQKFKPFQIRMKAVKINKHFSIRVLDQASVTLTFQDRPNILKLNLGMNLINSEIVDTETSEVSEVATPYDRIPARTQSVSDIQEALNRAKNYGKSIRNRMQSRSTAN